MRCPHCRTGFHDNPTPIDLGKDVDGAWSIVKRICSECGRSIFHLKRLYHEEVPHPLGQATIKELREQLLQVRPKGSSRPPCPEEVGSNEIKEDYEEACLVFPDSAKASASLSRRCLQNILREEAGVKPSNLFDEIQEVLDSKALPSYLEESIDAIRNIGNFAAHPIKSKNTGEIVAVEPGEAEWNLEVIEQLFDFYFVQPAKAAVKKEALNKKLKDAGKPPMK